MIDRTDPKVHLGPFIIVTILLKTRRKRLTDGRKIIRGGFSYPRKGSFFVLIINCYVKTTIKLSGLKRW